MGPPVFFQSVIKILLGSLGIAFLASFVLLVSNTFLPRYPYHDTPSMFRLPFETVQFTATDGLRLTGWLILKDKARPWIILCHGLGASKTDILPYGIFLYKRGFNLFFFDFRAHGESQGLATSFGHREQRDLEGAIRFLQKRYPETRLGVWGNSLGGAVALLVASRENAIRAVCADSPYHDLEGSLNRHLNLIFRLPRIPFGYFARWAYEIRFLTLIQRVSPVRVVDKISPRAVFLINGAKDQRMLATETKELYERAGEPREIWIAPEAGHLEAYSFYPEDYEGKVSSFFEKHLLELKR